MRRPASVLAVAALAACAPLPPAPEPTPAPSPPARTTSPDAAARHALVARHAKLAREARDAGDLRTAAEHYEVLVLVDPGQAAHREALRATRAAIEDGVQDNLRAAHAARRAGDAARARDAWLRVLVLDPSNGEAARGLRELEQQAMARTQADRAARAKSMEDVVAAKSKPPGEYGATPAGTADLEQRLELVRTADASIALREARAWAEANPADRPGRAKLAAALVERARDLEAKGQREWALPLYDQAIVLGATGDTAKRATALRKALAEEAYADGMRARSTDLAASIRYFESALRYDPGHARAKDRLREVRAAQKKLERIAK